MQTAENGIRNERSMRLDGARIGRIFRQGQMRAVGIVIFDIFPEHVAQMIRVPDRDMIETFASYRSYKPFDVTVLPRRMRHRRVIANPHGPKSAPENLSVSTVIIADDKTGRGVPRKRFGDLLREPHRSRVIRHLDMQKHASAQSEHDEGVKLFEAVRRHHQHVDGDNGIFMVMKKCFPTLRRPATAPNHIFGNRRLGYANAEPFELAVNARRTPKRIREAHRADQRTQFGIYARTSAFPPAEFSPPNTNMIVMPAHEQIGFVREAVAQRAADANAANAVKKDADPRHDLLIDGMRKKFRAFSIAHRIAARPML